MKQRKITAKAIPGILILSLVLVTVLGCGLVNSSSPQDIGAVAPDFTFPTTDGQTVQLSSFRGQPVLINFWATWCPPCRAEMDHLQAAFEEKGNEVKFIGVNLKEDRETVQEFAEEFGLTFTMALDTGGESSDTYNIKGIPTTVVVDERGVIRYTKLGPFQSKEEVVSMLNSL